MVVLKLASSYIINKAVAEFHQGVGPCKRIKSPTEGKHVPQISNLAFMWSIFSTLVPQIQSQRPITHHITAKEVAEVPKKNGELDGISNKAPPSKRVFKFLTQALAAIQKDQICIVVTFDVWNAKFAKIMGVLIKSDSSKY